MKVSTNRKVLLSLLMVLVLVLSIACNDSGSKVTEIASTSQAVLGTNVTTKSDSTKAPSYFNATGYPICDNPITLTVTGDLGSGTPDWNKTILTEQIAKRLGINLNCNPITHDAWDTQLTLMLSTNKLPDLILRSGLSASDVADYGSQGYFLAMNDLIDRYAPNLKSYMDSEEYSFLRPYMTSSDGKIYMSVYINAGVAALVPRVFMNKKWLSNVNMDRPKTINELYNVLTAYKKQDANGNRDPNDEIPMGNLDGYMESVLLPSFGIYSRSTTYILQADDKGTIYSANTTDNYKAYLTYLNRLYKEGLLDAECFIQTDDAFKAKLTQERTGFFGGAAPYALTGNPITYDANFIWSGAYTSEWNNKPTIMYNQLVTANPVVIANSKTKYPEAIVRLIDYFYTEEGKLAAHIGYEGLSYDIINLTFGGKNYSMQDVRVPEGYSSANDFRYKKAVIDGGFRHFEWVTRYLPLFDMSYETILSKETMAYYGWSALAMYYGIRNPDVTIKTNFPALIYTKKEIDKRSALYTDINTYLTSAKTQFITGEVNLNEGWANYVSTLKQMGLNDLIAIEQGAYNRLMKK